MQAVEAQIALETKLAAVRDLNLQVCQAQIQVAEKTLDLMMNRYRAIADRQERTLKEKAAQEDNTARRSEDPLERFIAHHTADLLELEAQVLKNEQAEVTSPPPSLNDQRSQADHAEADFARIKALLDDGRVSRLDAIRLNNDFRRIGPERDRLLRNEMTIVETRLQYYEDVLTSVEIELLQDSLHDRGELDRLRERLPASRWPEGEKILAELEQKHRALLLRRRASLERLTDCTTQTLEQISRRLSILDEEYGFIRTHIFWYANQEPIGLPTIDLGAGELQILREGPGDADAGCRSGRGTWAVPRRVRGGGPGHARLADRAVPTPPIPAPGSSATCPRTQDGWRVAGDGWRVKNDRVPGAGRAQGAGLLTPPAAGPQVSRSLEHRVRAERLVMPMRGLRSLVLGTAAAAIWPSYLLLMAYVAAGPVAPERGDRGLLRARRRGPGRTGRRS